MKKGKVVVILALAVVWMILIESFSWIGILSGIAIGIGCVFFSGHYLPLAKIKGVNFNKLITYPFYLIGQVFLSATYVSKIIFKGAKTDIVEIDTNIENDSIRVMLADSVTLTPGSVILELDGEKMTVLWLRERGSPEIEDIEKSVVAEKIMGKLEKRLIKAQK